MHLALLVKTPQLNHGKGAKPLRRTRWLKKRFPHVLCCIFERCNTPNIATGGMTAVELGYGLHALPQANPAPTLVADADINGDTNLPDANAGVAWRITLAAYVRCNSSFTVYCTECIFHEAQYGFAYCCPTECGLRGFNQ